MKQIKERKDLMAMENDDYIKMYWGLSAIILLQTGFRDPLMISRSRIECRRALGFPEKMFFREAE